MMVCEQPPKQSRLAKEHNVTPQEEAEIREAFSLFAEPMEGEGREGVIPTHDVRRALMYVSFFHIPSLLADVHSALGLPPTSPSELADLLSILDPDEELGYATFPNFFAVCALKIHNKSHSSEEHMAEVDEAFGLFASNGSNAITLASLKKVAKLLKMEEEVSEEVLRDMILEANGGAGVGRGVRKEEFEGVMRRAGVWR
uniref:EF-hand domain-containing protein n=1 Tax=Podospora anserina (strain S / ATCC MYA-4624 / DSM 980 / FGSC 10383) TaxID=515849 RepID=A0A090D577_PODAN|nr:Putative protein of unknown function [Podospora anserina S mat+]